MSRDLELSRVDVVDMLDALDVFNVQEQGDEVLFSCPFPGHSHGDEKPSAYMNRQTTAWFCHGCKRRGNAVTFVAEHENVSKLQATRFLREEYDSTFREPVDGSFAKEWDMHFKATPAEPEWTPEPLDESVVEATYIDWHEVAKYREREDVELGALSYMFDRGFSPETLAEFEVGYDDISRRIVFPVRDEQGRLIGMKGRAIYPDQKPKYLVQGDRPGRRERYGYQPYNSAAVVYNLHRAGERDRLVVVEGEFNVMAMHQMGHTNVVGLGGSAVTDRQMALVRWHCDEAVLFFDSWKEELDEIGPWYVPDKAGNAATALAIQKLEPHIRVLVTPDHVGDPADMTPDEVDGLLRRLVPSLELSMPM